MNQKVINKINYKIERFETIYNKKPLYCEFNGITYKKILESIQFRFKEKQYMYTNIIHITLEDIPVIINKDLDNGVIRLVKDKGYKKDERNLITEVKEYYEFKISMED